MEDEMKEIDLRSDRLIKSHGIAIRWESDGNSGAWIVAFHFAGPDIVAQGATPEAALENFIVAVGEK
jgi:hypothetical protein